MNARCQARLDERLGNPIATAAAEPITAAETGDQGASSDALERARDNGASAVADTLRGRLQELAPSRIDMVIESLDAALQAKKSARGYCKSCQTSVVVEVNDPIAAVNAFKALLEATEGKPATVEGVSQSSPLIRVRGGYRTTSG